MRQRRKKCVCCGREMCLIKFYKDISRQDNYSDMCFECHQKKHTKICNGVLCGGKEKNIIEFSKNRNNRDGVCTRCKICDNHRVINKGQNKYKKCVRCGKDKFKKCFYKDVTKDDCLSDMCFDCHVAIGTKICNSIWCNGKEKSVAEFSKHSGTRDGVNCYCSECDLKYHENFYLNTFGKVCERCNELKPPGGFYKDVSKEDGKSVLCRTCHAANKTKICNGVVCVGMVKGVEEFGINNGNQSGLNYVCVVCRRQDEKNRYDVSSYYQRKIAKGDLNYKIKHYLRTTIRRVLLRKQKAGSAVDDLGCSIECLREYIEFKFYNHPETDEKMTWDNWSQKGWHIDHIIPLSSFDLTDREQFLKAVHYTNLQPLWAEENLKKGAKIINGDKD